MKIRKFMGKNDETKEEKCKKETPHVIYCLISFESYLFLSY